jgi:hypothetical protein
MGCGGSTGDVVAQLGMWWLKCGSGGSDCNPVIKENSVHRLINIITLPEGKKSRICARWYIIYFTMTIIAIFNKSKENCLNQLFISM